MITLIQVEKLREYANISYEEAKKALEDADGDILQALIDLEQQGKVKSPEAGGRYQTGSGAISKSVLKEEKKDEKQGNSSNRSEFKQNMKRLLHWCAGIIHKGNVNFFVIEKNGETLMRLPITVLVLLLLVIFWIVLPLLIVGLFFNFRYTFQGPDIKNNTVNDAMNNVAAAAEEIKNDMRSDK